MSKNNSSLIFKAITNFVVDLSEIFDKHRPLKLYLHLIEKTTTEHELAVNKHINSFHKFCENNKDAILNMDSKSLSENPVISYSDRVFIDMSIIFDMNNDKETETIIWCHLLTIFALIDPNSGSKEKLQEQKSSSTPEGNFLSGLITTLDQHIDKDKIKDPMEAVGAIFHSGVMNDLISNLGNAIQNGDLNLGSLMSETQKFSETSVSNEIDTTVDTLPGSNNNAQPDFSAIMQSAMSLIGNMDLQEQKE